MWQIMGNAPKNVKSWFFDAFLLKSLNHLTAVGWDPTPARLETFVMLSSKPRARASLAASGACGQIESVTSLVGICSLGELRGRWLAVTDRVHVLG